MRRMRKWAWVVFAAVSVAAGAQQHGGHDGGVGAHPEFHAPRVQMPGSFVSLPGHAVFTPGQSVFTRGQSVFTPGQSVFTPGQEVFTPGNRVFPAPHVLTPFPGTAGRASAARPDWHGDHDRYHYRHRHGAGYEVPYLFGAGYWVSPYDLGYSDDTDEEQSTASVEPSEPAFSSTEQQQPADELPAEDSYRPEYHAPASAPNVIESQEPTLTVVMKDGTRKQMRNYALTPTTLIDLDAAASGREMNIPLGQVNVEATQKAAAEEGLSFNVPQG